MQERLTGRHWVLLGVLSSALCLSYFYLLDEVLFSSRGFAHIFDTLLRYHDVNAAWLAVGVCLAAACWRRPAPVLWAVDAIGAHPRRVAAALVVAAAAGSRFIYHHYPLCMDEYAAVFQSKVFASGRLYAQLPPALIDWLVPPKFNGLFLVASHTTGQVIEGYWPGFAALLTPFEWLHAPWLCNAILSGIALLLIFRITHEATGERRAAAWAVLFAISSGAFLAYAISYYSMQAHLTANLLFASLLWRPTVARSIAAGLVGSLAICLHNPFPHALFAAPWILALLLDRDSRRYLVPLGLAYLPGLAVMVAWTSLRGHIMPVAPGAPGSPFGWPDSMMLNTRMAGIIKLWVWATPGLLLIAFLGWRNLRTHRRIRLLAASAALTFIGYLFVRLDQGHGWGYRYFQSAWGVIPILAGCAMTSRARFAESLTPYAGAAALLSLVLIVPFQMSQIEEFISDHTALIPAPKRPGNNVYFIAPYGGSYVGDEIQIDPLLRDPDLLLASRGPQLDAALVMQNWPGAARVGRHFSVDQWYLGPLDRRSPGGATESAAHFELHFDSAKPNAAATD